MDTIRNFSSSFQLKLKCVPICACINIIRLSLKHKLDCSCSPGYKIRASIFSSIAIELNVPRDDFRSIAIELTFVILGHGFKKAGSVLLIFVRLGQGLFKSDYITRYLHTWVVLRLCIVFTIGESPRVCSKYSNWYYLLLVWGGAKVTSIEIELLLLHDGRSKLCIMFRFDRDRSRPNYFAHVGQRALGLWTFVDKPAVHHMHLQSFRHMLSLTLYLLRCSVNV